MLEYKIGDLVLMLSALEMARRDARHSDASGQTNFGLSEEWRTNFATCVDGAWRMCNGINLDSSLLSHMEKFRDELRIGTGDYRPAVIHANLDIIIEGIHNNLNQLMFMHIPKEDAGYWNNIELFGADFGAVFPTEAVLELAELGKCFAASRPTATVFHSMRIAEYGLRLLAKCVRVKLTDKGKPMPIDFGTWDKVIQGVRNRIAEIRKQPLGPKKENALQFYAAATDHCEYMKDIWRNEISHARHRLYTRDETLGVISRVCLFAKLIAEHEIPKNPRKHLDKINQRVRELRSRHEGLNQRSPQRDAFGK
jgi:hypothetical protein